MSNDWSEEDRTQIRKRHRGYYKKELHDIPFELSRSAVERYVQCPKCFLEEKVYGIKPPSIPPFLLNTNTDTLLKKDFDQYRGKEPHPIMVKAGLSHLIPFEHEDMERWEQSIHFGLTPSHFNTLHRESNILFGGGLDDVWQNKETGELHIVDYKSTAQMGKTPKPLDETFLAPPEDETKPDYKGSYRRQMDMYQWILARKGFEVSKIGYFLYVDGQHNGIDGMIDKNDPATAWMKFNTAIIPYENKTYYKARINEPELLRKEREYFLAKSWIARALMEIKERIEEVILHPTIHMDTGHTKACDLGRYLAHILGGRNLIVEDFKQKDEYFKNMSEKEFDEMMDNDLERSLKDE
jgi:hypothetical protein